MKFCYQSGGVKSNGEQGSSPNFYLKNKI